MFVSVLFPQVHPKKRRCIPAYANQEVLGTQRDPGAPTAGPEHRAQRLMQELLLWWAWAGRPGAKGESWSCSLVHTEMAHGPTSRSQRVHVIHLSGRPALPTVLPYILNHDSTMLQDKGRQYTRLRGTDSNCSHRQLRFIHKIHNPASWKLFSVKYFTIR